MVAMTDDELLTVKQVADRLKLGEETVRRWLRDGRLRGMRIGADAAGWRVRASDLQRYLDRTFNQAEG